MRSALVALLLTIGGCAAFGPPYSTPTEQAAHLDRMLEHVEMTRIDRLDSVLYVGHPQDVAWLCRQMGAWGEKPRGCQFTVMRDGLPDPVMVASRDDRTGDADVAVLDHERCHLAGGTERDCARTMQP